MNNKQLIIWFGIVLLIALTRFTYDTYIKPEIDMKSIKEIEANLEKAIYLSNEIRDDDTLSEIQKKKKQSKVNLVLQQLQEEVLKIDSNNKTLAKKIENITLEVHQKQLDYFLKAILDDWQKKELFLDSQSRIQLQTSWKCTTPNYPTKPLIKAINDAIGSSIPEKTTPSWLIEMDAFFSQKQKLKGKPFIHYSNVLNQHYVTLIALSLPLVSFDKIIELESFDDDYLKRQELMPILEFAVPRNIEEAKNMYSSIQALPNEFTIHSFLGEHSSSQPFKAQMMMVVLMQNHSKDKELFVYQKQLILTASEKLFNYPEYSTDPSYSARPSFWMAHSDLSDEFLHLISEKSTNVFKKHVNEIRLYKKKQKKFKQIIASNLPNDTRSITQRVQPSQMKLAILLEKFDRVLLENNISLPSSLNDDQINKLQSHISPLKLPEEYLTLYKWHNGITTNFYYLDIFLPIEQNLYEYDLLQEYQEWDKTLFPLNAFNGDTYWLINMEFHPSSKIFYHFVEDASFEKDFLSIEHMIRVYLKAIDDKILYYDIKTGEWEINEIQFKLLKQSLTI